MTTLKDLFAALVAGQSIARRSTGHVAVWLVLTRPNALFDTWCAGFMTSQRATIVRTANLYMVRKLISRARQLLFETHLTRRETWTAVFSLMAIFRASVVTCFKTAAADLGTSRVLENDLIISDEFATTASAWTGIPASQIVPQAAEHLKEGEFVSLERLTGIT